MMPEDVAAACAPADGIEASPRAAETARAAMPVPAMVRRLRRDTEDFVVLLEDFTDVPSLSSIRNRP
jgi:hypothetical protein